MTLFWDQKSHSLYVMWQDMPPKWLGLGHFLREKGPLFYRVFIYVSQIYHSWSKPKYSQNEFWVTGHVSVLSSIIWLTLILFYTRFIFFEYSFFHFQQFLLLVVTYLRIFKTLWNSETLISFWEILEKFSTFKIEIKRKQNMIFVIWLIIGSSKLGKTF